MTITAARARELGTSYWRSTSDLGSGEFLFDVATGSGAVKKKRRLPWAKIGAFPKATAVGNYGGATSGERAGDFLALALSGSFAASPWFGLWTARGEN